METVTPSVLVWEGDGVCLNVWSERREINIYKDGQKKGRNLSM